MSLQLHVHAPARRAARHRAFILLPLVALLLGGCAQRWAKPGASEADFRVASMRCAAEGHRRLPPDLRWVQLSAGHFAPGHRWCWKAHGQRRCDYVPGHYVPPRFGHVDINVAPRDSFFSACLVDDGWRPVD